MNVNVNIVECTELKSKKKIHHWIGLIGCDVQTDKHVTLFQLDFFSGEDDDDDDEKKRKLNLVFIILSNSRENIGKTKRNNEKN